METPGAAQVLVDSTTSENKTNTENVDGKEKGKNYIPEMGFFKSKVYEVLQKVNDQAAGEFAISSKLNDAPTIVLDFKNANCKRVHFPLYEDEADGIFQIFKQSPYGKGTQTVVDKSVRNSWQLEPDRFEILNPDWDSYIKDVLLPLIGKAMRIDHPFTSTLYKLLFYKPGSFFKPHRDSEKEDGMFATLVIQLPSVYKGGQLLVSHDGKVKTFDLSSGSNVSNGFSTFCTVFYCDCEHEVLPITEGFRFCLIYNLVSLNSDFIPVAPERSPFEKELKGVLQNWNSPRKLVYAFKHKYSEKNLSFDNLKTTDRAIFAILKHLSKKFHLDVHLAIFEKTSFGRGDADQNIGFWKDELIDFDSEDENQLIFQAYSLHTFTGLSGNSHDMLPNSRLSIHWNNEVMPEDCFSNIEPYSRTEDPTGNEGVHVTKSYRSAAIVFWPKKYLFDVLKSSNTSNAQWIEIFIKELEIYKGKETNEGRKMLLDFAETVTRLKPQHKYNCESSAEEKETEENNELRLLTALVELNDLPSTQGFFECSLTLRRQAFSFVIQLCQHFGWQSFAKQLVPLIKRAKSREEAVEFFDLMIEDKINLEENREMIFKVMYAFLENYKNIGEPPHSFGWYERESARAKILEMQKTDVKSIIRVAQKVNFDMIELLQKLFQDFIIMDEIMLPGVVKACNKRGWKSFVAQVPFMFERVSTVSDAAKLLDLFIEKDNLESNRIDDSKKEICCKVLDTICEKIKKPKPSYGFPPKVANPEIDEEFLYSLCLSAHKINFKMMEFMKTRQLNIAVPVLTKLARSVNQRNVLLGQWLTISKYFVREMKKLTTKEIGLNWRLKTDKPCWCKNKERDCAALDVFLQSDLQSWTFNVERRGSSHLTDRIKNLEANGITQETKDEINTFVLVATKTLKGGQEDLNKQNIAAQMLPNLMAVMPK